MGTRLIVEVVHAAPATLTHREAWVLAVLAEDAHDETRTTQSSVEDENLLRRARVSRPQMYAVLRALIAKGVLKRTAAGHRHGAARYELLPLSTAAPAPIAPEAPTRPARKPPAQPPQPRRARPAPRVAPAGFEEFWETYPRKAAKGSARTAYAKAVKRGADPTALTAAAAKHAAQWRAAHTEARFIPYPATWLNQERYEDETDPAPGHQQPQLPTGRYQDPTEKGIF
ncbi:hypothetical protein ABZ369_06580 [Streptomyces sp. NPDC005918]|uniref:hypothetical protein n=1 Tax=Streptomyces sp. NPDC005918 TaxID=3155454 RepID=UPI0033F84743